MPDGTPNGETDNGKAPSNNATTPAAPVANASDQAEVERLRKEKEQAEMRARQLENEADARKKADEEAEKKKLEENEQFKTLHEQDQAKIRELEADKAANEKKAEVKTKADEVMGEFSPEVRKLAEEVGVSLTDTDEASVNAFKERLDKLNAPFGGNKRVTPNNPNNSTPGKPTFENADGVIEKPLDKDPQKMDQMLRDMPGIASMMGPLPED